MKSEDRWQCESGGHCGIIEPNSLLFGALQIFREKGGKGPSIIPDISCAECHPTAKKSITPERPH